MKKLVVVGFVLGCSTYHMTRVAQPVLPPFRDNLGDLAEICVFRKQNPVDLLGLMETEVRDNGMLVGATQQDTYFCYRAGAGVHTIESLGTFGVRVASLDAAAGERYFLEVTWLWPVFRGHELYWMEQEPALAAMTGDDYGALDGLDEPVYAPARRAINGIPQ
jgi:hypothetical protein